MGNTELKVRKLTEFFIPKNYLYYLTWDEKNGEVLQFVLQKDQNCNPKFISRFKL